MCLGDAEEASQSRDQLLRWDRLLTCREKGPYELLFDTDPKTVRTSTKHRGNMWHLLKLFVILSIPILEALVC